MRRCCKQSTPINCWLRHELTSYIQSYTFRGFTHFSAYFRPHSSFNNPAMHLPDTMYCSQQINIPPELPDILKQFTKAAIRTQPKDLLLWSSAYFNALSKGEILPVKDRLEMNVATQKTDTGLTPGLLKTLHKQLSHRQTCNKEELQKKWKGLCLPMEQLETLLSLGSFGSDIDWMEFFALGCSALGGGLLHSLKYACEILTKDDEGGAARIPFDIFVKLYTYLAHLDGDLSRDYVDKFLSSLQEQVNKQNGMIQVSNFSISRQGGKERWKAIDDRKEVIEVTK